MLCLLLAAALAAPPSVEGFVGRRFDAVGNFTGYVLSRRADVYNPPVVLPLVTTARRQEDILEQGGAVRVVGHRGRLGPTDVLVIESVAASRDFPEFP